MLRTQKALSSSCCMRPKYVEFGRVRSDEIQKLSPNAACLSWQARCWAGICDQRILAADLQLLVPESFKASGCLFTEFCVCQQLRPQESRGRQGRSKAQGVLMATRGAWPSQLKTRGLLPTRRHDLLVGGRMYPLWV